MNKNIKKWILPVIVSLFIFFVARPIIATEDERKVRLSEYLRNSDLEVGTEVLNDRTHVYYVFEDEKKFVTDDNFNNKQPFSKGEYIVYVKEVGSDGQIFLYHVLTEKSIKITSFGQNLKPNVDKWGNIAWEVWDGNTWQIQVFDGQNSKIITEGDLANSPTIYKDYVLYTRRDEKGGYRSEAYSLLEDKSKEISIGSGDKNITLRGEEIVYGDGKTLPLKVSDFFLLDIVD